MDHAAAEAKAEELRREHPDRFTHTWMARGNRDGEWEVVKVRIPGGPRAAPTGSTSEAKPKPAPADDPRPAPFRDVPPFGGAA